MLSSNGEFDGYSVYTCFILSTIISVGFCDRSKI